MQPGSPGPVTGERSVSTAAWRAVQVSTRLSIFPDASSCSWPRRREALVGADSAKPTSEDRQPDEDPRLATEHDNPPNAKSAGASAQRHRGDEPAVVAGGSHVVWCHAVTSFAVGLGLVEDRVAPRHKSVRQLCGPFAIYSPLCRRIRHQFRTPYTTTTTTTTIHTTTEGLLPY